MKKKIKVKKQKEDSVVCARCEKKFPTRKALKLHSKAHLQAVKEMKMLEEGRVPEETKFGAEFKGKNRVIVA